LDALGKVTIVIDDQNGGFTHATGLQKRPIISDFALY
jgi:hypothetical protein